MIEHSRGNAKWEKTCKFFLEVGVSAGGVDLYARDLYLSLELCQIQARDSLALEYVGGREEYKGAANGEELFSLCPS